MSTHVRDLPSRLATGGFILHSGLGKWNGTEEQAARVHGMATAAFPFLERVPPSRFLKALSAAEIAIGAALLTPVVSNRLAGAALTTFSGALMVTYFRTPALHKPGSVWPTAAGTAMSKDVWMLGIGLGLLGAPEKPTRG